MTRIRFLGVAVALVVAGLTGDATAQESVLAKVKREGALNVCVFQGAPDNYKDPKTGEWHGVMIDLLGELANWMKVKVNRVEIEVGVAVLSLKRGDCDLIGSSLIFNVPRALEINYVRPFWAKGMNAIIPKQNPRKFKSPEDLNSDKVTIALLVGSREHETAQRLFPKAKLSALKVNADIQVADSVKRGDADAALLPMITIRWWLSVPENAAWGAMGFPGQDFGNAPNGWAIRYGDPDWKNFLDAFSGWVAANDIAVRLYDDYLKRTNPFVR